MSSKKITLSYRPHLTGCNENFTYTPSELDPVKAAAILVLFQNFLALESHSNAPYKSRVDFYQGESKHPQSVRMVHSVNNHKILPPESDQAVTFVELKEHVKHYIKVKGYKLNVSYFPQVPCSNLPFPAANELEAVEIRNMLVEYDNYLFERCSSMRGDFANMALIEILDDDEWVSWYKETEDNYFEEDSIEDYIESLNAA